MNNTALLEAVSPRTYQTQEGVEKTAYTAVGIATIKVDDLAERYTAYTKVAGRRKRTGVAFRFKQRFGYSLKLDTFPLDGRILLVPPSGSAYQDASASPHIDIQLSSLPPIVDGQYTVLLMEPYKQTRPQTAPQQPQVQQSQPQPQPEGEVPF